MFAVKVKVLFHDTLRLTMIHPCTTSANSTPSTPSRFAAEGIKKLRSLYAPHEHVLRVESVGTEPELDHAGTATEAVAPFNMSDSRTAAADAAPLMDDYKGAGDKEILRRENTGNGDDMSGASAVEVNLASAAADIDRVPKGSPATGMMHSEHVPVPPPQVAPAEPETLEGQGTANLEMDLNEGITLWRGLRNTKVTDAFTKSGGTEQALMSTTTDIGVAVQYSLSSFSLLFKIKAEDFMSMGADLQWLSAFPHEAEFLYPPLTYLEPTGRTSDVSVEREGQVFMFSIVEVIPVMG